MPPTPSCLVLVAAPMEANFYSLACGGGVCSCSTPIVCSCSTTSSLTCSLPTSNSSMLRRSILPLLIASARITKAPMARAPMAPAPIARAPNAAAPLAPGRVPPDRRPPASQGQNGSSPLPSAFSRSSFLVHHLPGLAFLPIAAPRPAPSEAEDAKGVCSQADAPAQQRPVKPPYPARQPARKGVDDKQTDVDHHEYARVDVEAFDGLHTSPGPFVALLLVLHS